MILHLIRQGGPGKPYRGCVHGWSRALPLSSRTARLSGLTIARRVSKMIFRSVINELSRTYFSWSLIFVGRISSKYARSGSLAPARTKPSFEFQIDAQSVTPGRTLKIALSSPENRAVNFFTSGRGPDDAHIAEKHVNQLRKFIQLVLPEKFSSPGDPRIVVGSGRRPHILCIQYHRSELKYPEGSTISPNPNATVKNRTFVFRFY